MSRRKLSPHTSVTWQLGKKPKLRTTMFKCGKCGRRHNGSHQCNKVRTRGAARWSKLI